MAVPIDLGMIGRIRFAHQDGYVLPRLRCGGLLRDFVHYLVAVDKLHDSLVFHVQEQVFQESFCTCICALDDFLAT